MNRRDYLGQTYVKSSWTVIKRNKSLKFTFLMGHRFAKRSNVLCINKTSLDILQYKKTVIKNATKRTRV